MTGIYAMAIAWAANALSGKALFATAWFIFCSYKVQDRITQILRKYQ